MGPIQASRPPSTAEDSRPRPATVTAAAARRRVRPPEPGGRPRAPSAARISPAQKISRAIETSAWNGRPRTSAPRRPGTWARSSRSSLPRWRGAPSSAAPGDRDQVGGVAADIPRTRPGGGARHERAEVDHVVTLPEAEERARAPQRHPAEAATQRVEPEQRHDHRQQPRRDVAAQFQPQQPAGDGACRANRSRSAASSPAATAAISSWSWSIAALWRGDGVRFTGPRIRAAAGRRGEISRPRRARSSGTRLAAAGGSPRRPPAAACG